MRKSLEFDRAFDLLMAHGHATAPHPELGAIVSHWLNDPTRPPIYFGDKVADAWSTVLEYDRRFGRGERIPGEPMSRSFYNASAVIDFSAVPFGPPAGRRTRFAFIDLFAGIGGFRIALQNLGGRGVFSSDIDERARDTYLRNFGEYPFGDIRQFTGTAITDGELDALVPEHDVLAAGFPCQPFSRAGVSARGSLGQVHGFADETQGTLFFDILRVAAVKKPAVLFLENVGNLRIHDRGRTFRVIEHAIRDLGYSFSSALVDASGLVPQRRKRTYMVCFRDGRPFEFDEAWFDLPPLPLRSVLEKDPDPKYTISDRLWKGHQDRTRRNLERGTGFTAFMANIDKPSNTLVARYGKDGKECLISQEDSNPRMLTPRECARLQGFPEEFIIPSAKTVAYRQFGNAVAVPVVERLATEFLNQARR